MVVAILSLFGLITARLVELDQAEFKRLRTDKVPMPVVFYAPWCGHCQRLKPEYAKAAEELDGILDLYMVDCTNSTSGGQAVCSEYGVQGFPTVKLLNGASRPEMEYTGAREAVAIRSFILTNIEKPFVEHKTVGSLMEAYQSAKTSAKKHLFIVSNSTAASKYLFKVSALYKEKADVHVFLRATEDKLAELKEAGLGHLKGALSMFTLNKGKASHFDGGNKPSEIEKWLHKSL